MTDRVREDLRAFNESIRHTGYRAVMLQPGRWLAEISDDLCGSHVKRLDASSNRAEKITGAEAFEMLDPDYYKPGHKGNPDAIPNRVTTFSEAVEGAREATQRSADITLDQIKAADATRNRVPGSTVLASEADYEDGVRCVVMPCCAFTFDACHTDDKSDPPTYTCPQCGGGT